ncbi:hypothetical protein ABEB36_014807 [Hypothenemus hampei]|uniref:THAP-type domain-containing protein n=1 Tax=Hypothenemus hampei TaxID=57062 RepID=A0ABD1E170_HYPHA
MRNFPTNPDLRKKWMEACFLTDVKKGCTVCSEHFKSCDFLDSVDSLFRRKLKPNAVPSPSHRHEKIALRIHRQENNNLPEDKALGQNYVTKSCVSENLIKPCRSPEKRKLIAQLDDNVESIVQEPQQHTQSTESSRELQYHEGFISDARYIGDITVSHFSSPRKAKRHLDLIKQKAELDRNKIHSLHKKKRQFEKEVLSMKDLLVQLRDQKLLSDEAAHIISVRIDSIMQRQH